MLEAVFPVTQCFRRVRDFGNPAPPHRSLDRSRSLDSSTMDAVVEVAFVSYQFARLTMMVVP